MRWCFSCLVVIVLCPFACPARAADPTPDTPDRQPPFVVTHRPDEGGWSIAETDHFRIYHRHRPEYIDRLARVAERTRGTVLRKWFGKTVERWERRCELYLYPTARDYAVQTGAPPGSPGHTRILDDNDRILARQVHLHVTGPDFLRTIVPHEVTHAVLAGHFGAHRVPRWADEGMAVLSETAERIDEHLHDLWHWRDDGVLFGARELLEQADYPAPQRMGAFYSESVSLVRFLATAKGPEEFTHFVRDGLSDGYAAALRQHYGWDYRELQRRWLEQAFADEADRPGRATARRHFEGRVPSGR
jgi:hypothetical protein